MLSACINYFIPLNKGNDFIAKKKGNGMKRLLYILFLCLIVCSGADAQTIPDTLKGKTVGVQLGTTGDTLATDLTDIKTERYNNGNDAVQSLIRDKVAAVILDEQPALAFIRENPGLVIMPHPFAEEEYAIAVSKEKTALKNDVNRILAEIKTNGMLQAVIDGYINSENQERFSVPENQDHSAGTLRIATNATFPPYEYYENEKVTGIDIDLAKIIAAKLHKKLVIEEMAFDSIIGAIQSGKADLGLSGMSVTPDRLKNIDFSIPYTISKQVIIVKSAETVVSSRLSLSERFKNDFIKKARWKYLTTGLKHTLIITVLAVLIGILAGGLIAVVRVSHDENGSFPVLNFLCRVYLTVIRGTPMTIQLLIMYYVIFSAVNVHKILVAVLAFGINSAAYVAEIIRSGILSVDHGQTEAGRSLGLSFSQTMRFIVLPQALKNALPSLANEFIALIKETSICGYIGLMDLTRGGDVIRSITYDAFLPLTAVALIYLVLVLVLTTYVSKLEKRLKRNER